MELFFAVYDGENDCAFGRMTIFGITGNGRRTDVILSRSELLLYFFWIEGAGALNGFKKAV